MHTHNSLIHIFNRCLRTSEEGFTIEGTVALSGGPKSFTRSLIISVVNAWRCLSSSSSAGAGDGFRVCGSAIALGSVDVVPPCSPKRDDGGDCLLTTGITNDDQVPESRLLGRVAS